MAGKTTYLRSSALCIYLAHAGMGVPAASFSFAPCDTLFTAFGLVDDVRNRTSFFQAEARRARAVAAAIAQGERVVALLDEPFKGTNVRDAFQASTELLQRIAGCRGCLFVVSSHLIEVAEKLKGRHEVACCCFAAAEDGDRLKFDYQLRTGVSAQRLGMRVLQEHEVFSLLDAALAKKGNGIPAEAPAAD